MKQKRMKGFTLIELLAVIVILAIIALIAVPVIMNIISKANKSAFKDSAYGVVSAGELYFAEQVLEPNGMTSDVTITLPDTTNTLQLKGDVPTGQILITKDGKVAIAVSNGRYCITKGLDDKDITVTEDIANCNLPSGEVNPPENNEDGDTSQTGSLSSLATTSTEVTSKPACLTDGTTCAQGTPVAVKVNASEVYNFYVISETDNEVTLIMDRNLYSSTDANNGNVAWYSDGDDTTSNETNASGPRTAVAELKTRTSGWSNIPERTYTYSDDSGGNMYESFSETMRARMLTYTEVNNIRTANNYTKPNWMYINLKNTGDDNTYGYWLSTAAYSSYTNTAPNVNYDGNHSYYYVYYGTVNGVRPVITLSK